MSIRQTIQETFRGIKEEYSKVEFSDKILDLISIVSLLLFFVSLISVFVSGKFNTINIVFIVYPLIVSGMSIATRMKRREKPETTPDLFKEWLWIFGTITVIALIVIIIAAVIA